MNNDFDFVKNFSNFVARTQKPSKAEMINKYIAGTITKAQLDDFMKRVRMRNIDKIKAMDIDDLTQLLYDDACLHCWFYHNTDDKSKCDLRKCKFYVKKWLLQEAE